MEIAGWREETRRIQNADLSITEEHFSDFPSILMNVVIQKLVLLSPRVQNFSSLKCTGSSETISRNVNPVVYAIYFRKISYYLFDLKMPLYYKGVTNSNLPY